MDERLERAYEKVINRHYSVVQTDTRLEFTHGDIDDWKLEKKLEKFRVEYREAEAEFKALLHRCTVGEKA